MTGISNYIASMKIKNILDGWSKVIAKNPETEVVAKKRAKICAECPFAQTRKLLYFVPDKGLQNIEGAACDKCGCPLSAKVRSKDESCPLGKW